MGLMALGELALIRVMSVTLRWPDEVFLENNTILEKSHDDKSRKVMTVFFMTHRTTFSFFPTQIFIDLIISK